MKLKQSPVVVGDLTGNVKQGLIIECPRCGGDSFHIFVILPENHQRVQCLDCATTYCDGKCNDPKAKISRQN